jgi:hypothetical protein
VHDRFTGKFYKVYWPIIKTDVMAAMSAIWSRNFGKFFMLNSTYITLLPKKDVGGSENQMESTPDSMNKHTKVTKRRGQGIPESQHSPQKL